MSLFSIISTDASAAVAFVEGIGQKAETELTAAELYVRDNAPAIAQDIDAILQKAKAVAGDIDPAAATAVGTLQAVFDALISLIEGAASVASPGSEPAV